MAILYLASGSQSRKDLLRLAHIPFIAISQTADEASCNWSLPLPQLVSAIARLKMDHAVIPPGSVGDVAFVLTADTLSMDMAGNIHGKPCTREEAIFMLKAARDGARLATGFCLDRFVWQDGAWYRERRIEQVVHAAYQFCVPDHWIDAYLAQSPSFEVSNAIAVEGYGLQFLQTVDGSYTTILGLPLFELREALTTLGFFDF